MNRPFYVALLLLLLTNALFAQHHVVINEIMYAPKSPEPEWVELFNPDSVSVDVTGWKLSDKVKTYNLPSAILEPKGFIILTSDSAKLRASHPFIITPIIQGSLPAFNNDGDAVILHNANDILIDSLVYTSKWGGTGGISLERIDYDAMSDSTNFSSSIASEHSTPGLPNSIRRRDNDLAIVDLQFSERKANGLSLNLIIKNNGRIPVQSFSYELWSAHSLLSILQGTSNVTLEPLQIDTIVITTDNFTLGRNTLDCTISLDADDFLFNDTVRRTIDATIFAKELLINELMLKPLSSSCQWVELYNTSVHPADLAGCSVIVQKVDTAIGYSIDSLQIPSRSYGLVAASEKIFTSYSNTEKDNNIFIRTKPALSFDASLGQLSLYSKENDIIDSLSYNIDNYSQNINSEIGLSIERKNNGVTIENNWDWCVDNLGATPLKQNSLSFDKNNEQPEITLTVDPNPISPDGDGFNDAAVITLSLPTDDEALYSLTIYDKRGIAKRSIAAGKRIVRSASFNFDGKDDHGKSLPVGLYTLIAEPGGSAMSIKKGIVVTKR